MAYSTVSKKSGKVYHLHSKDVTLRGGHKQTHLLLCRLSGHQCPGHLTQWLSDRRKPAHWAPSPEESLVIRRST